MSHVEFCSTPALPSGAPQTAPPGLGCAPPTEAAPAAGHVEAQPVDSNEEAVSEHNMRTDDYESDRGYSSYGECKAADTWINNVVEVCEHC